MAQSDQQIISDVLQGDSRQYAVLVARHQKKLFTFMMRLSRSSQDAEDLTQEAFLRAYQKIETFHPGRSFRNWLFAISLNLHRDMVRRQSSRFEKSEAMRHELDRDTAPGVENEAEQRSETEKLLLALGKLPVEYKEALSLRYENDFSMAEIARISGVSVSGAKMRVARGLEKLRKIYALRLEKDERQRKRNNKA